MALARELPFDPRAGAATNLNVRCTAAFATRSLRRSPSRA